MVKQNYNIIVLLFSWLYYILSYQTSDIWWALIRHSSDVLGILSSLRIGWQHFSRDYRRTKREYPPTPVTNPEYLRTRFLLRFLLNHIYTADIRDVINKYYILRIISGVKICVRIKSAVA